MTISKTGMFSITLLAGLALSSALPVKAAFIVISQPTAAYTTGTALLPITAPDNTNVSSVTDGTVTVNFSAPIEALTVPTTFATWGSAPNTEGPLPPRVLEQDPPPSNLTLTFSKALATFGFELQPDDSRLTPTFNVNFLNGATSVGTISQAVSGNAGARLFAASTDTQFTSVTITGDDFAIARLRYAAVSAPTPGIPEPGTVLLMLGGFAALGLKKLSGSRL